MVWVGIEIVGIISRAKRFSVQVFFATEQKKAEEG
jgi:hypothetical protein